MKGLDTRLSRRGLVVGLAALTASCATGSKRGAPVVAQAPAPLVVPTEPLAVPPPVVKVQFDPLGLIRKPLLDGGLEALKRHEARIPTKDQIYLVDFQQHSSLPRLYRLDLASGEVTAFRTAHGKGSDPAHSGFAQRFSNVMDSNASSVGAYVTAGPGMGAKHGPNVLLDGLEPTNSEARDRAIIIHAADYCEPEFLAREGKLGRSYGCFSVSTADLQTLRPIMGEGRLLFAAA
ncbi:murein L,D-transpeptidase catalytic domain family protein [Caulobacter mirabilis]|uniref:Twin-arginine translocation pathway signal n=1 Tax=Caulobacter mirabilis TaxID=69666 RepID=A0A2D2B1S8_9CAUL|nr:murein L,D-transpeptidase catalytic domain family protein [Caulobacter mirabilis]ATQ44214.1 twin-arginine translocation pathway signal [Caulobacter mirabilis]